MFDIFILLIWSIIELSTLELSFVISLANKSDSLMTELFYPY